jgi:ADP-heptose:LPS heptosyltransferase
MKILFIGNTRLGDAILSTSILNYYSGSHITITIVCSPLTKNIYKNFPNVKDIIAVNKKKRGKHWLEIYSLLESVCWDLVIDLRNSILSRLIRKKNILRIGKVNPYKHRVESLCKLINTNEVISPRVPVNNKAKQEALRIISDKDLVQPILALAPVTNWQRKNWPLENFELLINSLMKKSKDENSFKSVIVLGSEKEKDQCDYLIDKLSNINIKNLCGYCEITVIYALLKHCRLFVGNDSGLMHLAAAANINTLGLFGPSKEINYRPWGNKSYFLRTESNYDDLVNVKGYNRHHNSSLMKTLTVEKVLRKCHVILDL